MYIAQKVKLQLSKCFKVAKKFFLLNENSFDLCPKNHDLNDKTTGPRHTKYKNV